MPRHTANKKSKKVSGKFTTAEDLKNTFLKITSPRQAQEISEDATYWTGGRCDWGGSHNLQEDCEKLGEFFNSVANINEKINNIKLSANEGIFEINKRELISKIQDCISKCNISESYSIANICCIWNDFFGIFLKKYLDEFSKKLKRQLTTVEKLEAKHQKELLDLESQANATKKDYEENLRKANDPSLNEEEKANFIALANKAARKAEEIKRKIKNNSIVQAGDFNFLDDLRVLSGGNVPKNVTSDKKNPSSPSKNTPSSQAWLQENKQLILFVIITTLTIFYFYNQEENPNYYEY